MGLQPRGYMTSAGTTTYSVDADGWLVSRQEENIPPDTYAIIRSGGRVAEEQFTRAYPSIFYVWNRPQRVRYNWDGCRSNRCSCRAPSPV